MNEIYDKLGIPELNKRYYIVHPNGMFVADIPIHLTNDRDKAISYSIDELKRLNLRGLAEGNYKVISYA